MGSVLKRLVVLLLVLAVAVVALPPLWYALRPAEEPELPPAGRRIPVADGAAVNALEWGEGPPVVLVHGLPGSAYDWKPLGRALAERGLHALAYDRVGYGRSTPRSNDAYTPAGNARDLLALLEQEDLRDTTVVGWSYGGPVAILAARRDPSRIGRLVLLGSGGPSDDPQEPPAIFALLSTTPVKWWLAAVPPAGHGLQAALSQRAFSEGPVPPWWLPQLAANFARPEMRRTYYAEGERFTEDELGIEEVELPMLLIHGDDDRLAPLAIGEWLDRHAPTSRLRVVKKGSHMLPITHADRLADEIEAFTRGGLDAVR